MLCGNKIISFKRLKDMLYLDVAVIWNKTDYIYLFLQSTGQSGPPLSS